MTSRMPDMASVRRYERRGIAVILLIAVLAAPLAVGDVVDKWAQRMSRVDSIYVEFRTQCFWVGVDKDIRNRDNWRVDPDRSRTIVCRAWLRRPDCRIERTVAPSAYQDTPTTRPTSDSSWVSGQLRTLGGSAEKPSGTIMGVIRAPWLKVEPFFTPLEFHAFDYAPMDLAADLLAKPRTVEGDAATIAITSGDNPCTLRVELAADEVPYPLRLTMTIGSSPERQVFWDMETLATASVGGVPVISKARITLYNPDVLPSERCVYLWEATKIESRPITRSDLEVAFPNGTPVKDYITNTEWIAGDPSSVTPVDPERERRIREALQAQILTPGIESRRHSAAWWILVAAFSATLVLALGALAYRRWKAARQA